MDLFRAGDPPLSTDMIDNFIYLISEPEVWHQAQRVVPEFQGDIGLKNLPTGVLR